MRYIVIIPFLFFGCKASYVLDKPEHKLPAPKTSYLVTSDSKVDITSVIKEYVSANFDLGRSKKTILINSKNNHNCCGCEICSSASIKKVYGNIIITDTFHCDSPKNIFEFIGYKLEDVVKTLKLLFKDGDYYKWHENSYDIMEFNPDFYSGSVEVLDEGDRILVLIQMAGCQD